MLMVRGFFFACNNSETHLPLSHEMIWPDCPYFGWRRPYHVDCISWIPAWIFLEIILFTFINMDLRVKRRNQQTQGCPGTGSCWVWKLVLAKWQTILHLRTFTWNFILKLKVTVPTWHCFKATFKAWFKPKSSNCFSSCKDVTLWSLRGHASTQNTWENCLHCWEDDARLSPLKRQKKNKTCSNFHHLSSVLHYLTISP